MTSPANAAAQRYLTAAEIAALSRETMLVLIAGSVLDAAKLTDADLRGIMATIPVRTL